MARRGTTSPVSENGSYTEEKSKTFVVPDSRQSEDIDGDDEDDIAADIDTERMVRIINRKFAMKEEQLKNEMREEFEARLTADRNDNELKLILLKKDMTILSKVSEECEHLKELQKTLRNELNTHHNQIVLLTLENAQLKKNASKMEDMSRENQELKSENEILRKDNAKKDTEIKRLSCSILVKEKEIGNLKQIVDTQYKKLKLDLSNTRDKFNHEQDNIHADMKKQGLMLSEISEVVKTISKGIEDDHKISAPVSGTGIKRDKLNVKIKPFLSSKTTQKSTVNKLTELQLSNKRK